MNKVIQKFKQIRKALWGTSLLYLLSKASTYSSPVADNNIKISVEDMRTRDELRRKAERRANRQTKAPLLSNNTAKLLEALFRIGAYDGMTDKRGNALTFNTAVDGISGNLTIAAIEKAKLMGYDVDISSGKVNKKESTIKTVSPSKKEKFITVSGANIPSLIIDLAILSKSNSSNPIFRIAHDNMYPYLYENPGRKFLKAFFKKDPRRKSMDLFIELDLSQPENKAIASLLKLDFTNLDSNRDSKELLQAMRARRDLMSIYDTNSLKYNSFKINESYNSPTAGNNPTYVISDDNLRRKDLIAMATYLANHLGEGKLSKDGKSLIYPVTGDVSLTRGDYSIVTDLDGKHPRVVDEWNYKGDSFLNPTHNIVVTADTIPENYMKYKGKNTVVHTTLEDDDFSWKEAFKNLFNKK